MATKKKTDIQLLNEMAERLQQVRMNIKTAEARFKAETDADYTAEKELKAELVLGMKKIGIKSVGVIDGDTYALTKTHDFVTNNPIAEMEWAKTQRVLRIDRTLIKQRYRDALKKNELPDFVEAVPRETISIRTAKKDKDTKEEAAEDSG